MNFIKSLIQWRKRREALAEEKRRMLKERLARVFAEQTATHKTSRRDEVERRYREVMQATRG